MDVLSFAIAIIPQIWYNTSMKTKDISYESCIEAAKRWGISDRRVRDLAVSGKIPGAVREGKLWKIPVQSPKPSDGRVARGKGIPFELQGLFAEIDALKASLAEKRSLTDGEVKRLREAFLVDYTHASTAIEGNTLTLSETALALSGMTIAQKPLKDHLEAIGHRDAFLFLEDAVRGGEVINERFVLQLHSLVLADQPMDRGVYRRIPVVITGAVHTPPQPYLVQPLMEEWVRDLASTRLHPLVAAAIFHVRFEAIHPFIDGNGRTGRLLANFILMQSGFLPVSIKYEDRVAYYNAFSAYHSLDDIGPMLRIFAEAERTRLQAVLGILT